MKQFKYLLLMLMALLSFSACESEDEEQESYDLYKYIKITDIRSERVGSVLRIDYTMKNVSGKKLSDIRFSYPVVLDNTGAEYYNNNDFSIRGGKFKSNINFSLDKDEKASGAIVVKEFDPTGEANRVDLSFEVVIASLDFNGKGGYKKLSIAKDDRHKIGIQTNDTGLTYSNCSCKYQNGTVYLTFDVTADMDINDFKIGDINYGCYFYDNQSNSYWGSVSLSVNGGSYESFRKSISLRKGRPTTLSFEIKGFATTATEISTGYVTISSESYPMTDDRVRFFNIPIEK